MWKISLTGAFLAVTLTLAQGQGYGNIEDDSAPQKPIPPSQQISSLPQYESDPALSSEGGYGQAPNSNLQNSPQAQNADQSQNQDFWWMNQKAFQKPPGHPGVEQAGQSAPASQPKPFSNPQQPSRNPNAYNPSSPSQNSYQQPQQPAPYKPQINNNSPYQQSSPSFGSPSSPSSNGGGWQAPSAGQAPAPSQPSGFNAPPPPNNYGGNNAVPTVAFECMLLNKADCIKGAKQPSPNNFQPQYPSEPSGGYNAPPKQPQQQPKPQTQPFQQPPSIPQNQPAGYYKPPQPQAPQPNIPYGSPPQNYPSNQNNEPQYQPDSLPSQSNYGNSPYTPQAPSPPQQQYNQPAPPPPQQQYNKPAPPAPAVAPYSPPQVPSRPFNNQQQIQNNAQGIRPNNNNQQPQQPQNYDDQLPYPGCPAAMLCVTEDRCNLIGVIEDNPLGLSAAEKANRVALSRCSAPSTGVEGVCCRDPNYKDPWPDMQGGGNGGGGHHHHHEDNNPGQSQSQSSGQGQSPNFQSQPANNFKNPYAGLRRNLTAQRQNYKSEFQFQSCPLGEACVIAYKCQEGFLKSTQDKKPIEHDKGNSTLHKNVKKCKEDIFKNAFVCCKVGTVNSGNTRTTTVAPTTTKKTTYRPTTLRPLTTTTFRSTPARSTSGSTFSQYYSSTKEAIYKNNYLLTNTLAPTPTSEIEITQSTLTTGLGLRFHSHLHTKSAITENEAKPNPYGSERAIIPLDSQIVDLGNVSTEDPGNFSETPSNSIELLGSASNTKSVQPVVVLEVRETKSANKTAETVTTNSTVEIYSKLDINKIPENVPLSQEYSTYPPVGFIFKGNDLYIPEVDIPSQNFLPPAYEYEAKKKIEVIEVAGVTDNDLAETTTVPDIEL